MAEDRWGKFVSRTVEILRSEAPAYIVDLSHDEAEFLVDSSARFAESCGLQSEQQMRRFVALETVAGERFDSDPDSPLQQQSLQKPILILTSASIA